jgi:hypothetical protein
VRIVARAPDDDPIVELARRRHPMKRPSTETPEEDVTLKMLATVNDGSVASLATYHLLKMQLHGIRNLPERAERDRNAGPD